MMFAFFSNILIFFKKLFSKKKTKRTRIHPTHSITRSEMAEILVRLGLTHKLISIELGVSEDTFSKWLRLEKIPDRAWLHIQSLLRDVSLSQERAKQAKPTIDVPKQLALVELPVEAQQPPTQKCIVCGKDLAFTEFYKDKSHHTGRKTSCKECNKLYQKNRYARSTPADEITVKDLEEEKLIAKNAQLSTLVKKFKGSKYLT